MVWYQKNGIYLISEDNLSEIHHFTTLNSPLLSNGIESIAINEKRAKYLLEQTKVYAHICLTPVLQTKA